MRSFVARSLMVGAMIAGPVAVPVAAASGAASSSPIYSSSVSVANSGDVWALGGDPTSDSFVILAHLHNGTWHTTRVPQPTGGFAIGIVAASKTTVWVTNTGYEDAKIWRLSKGKFVEVPTPAVLASDSTTIFGANGTSLTNVWVFGYTDHAGNTTPLALHWNGKSWTSTKVPATLSKFPEVISLSSSSASSAFALGAYFSGGGYFAFQWNGKKWTDTHLKVSKPLYSVASSGPKQAYLVGLTVGAESNANSPQELTGYSWDAKHKRWDKSHTPTTRSVTVKAVSASGSTAVAVGSRSLASGITPYIARLAKGKWTNQTLPNVPGNDNFFSSITMTSPTSAWAFGQSETSVQKSQMVLHFDGKKWKVAHIPG